MNAEKEKEILDFLIVRSGAGFDRFWQPVM
jgi:hypothetical protein